MVNADYTTLNSPVRQIKGKVELVDSSTAFTYTDALKSITIERVGESGKFFGFGVCQKLNFKLRDINREFYFPTDTVVKPYLSADNEYKDIFPKFFITENHRDENTNELSVTAYDALNKASALTVDMITLEAYTIREYAEACASLLGLSLSIDGVEDLSCFETSYTGGANFEGTETLREALNAVAEATQTIYFVSGLELKFKRLGGTAALTIGKESYITLDSGENRRLVEICSATELGDNVSAALAQSGTTQYVRNNPFWELRDDIADLVNNALAAIGGLTINQFNCSWRGNYFLEIGDKIELITKDNKTVSSFVLNDIIEYNGGLKQTTQWSYTDNAAGSLNNPTSLGEVLKQTYAKVDKANKEIAIVASEANANREQLSQLQISTNDIKASVSNIQSSTTEAINGLSNDITALTLKTELQLTKEEVSIQVKSELNNGLEEIKIEGKDFSFNKDGLTIEDINPDTNKQIRTTVSNNGMTVYAENKEVLKANDLGVQARDLYAITYLRIGNNSRLQDNGNRTVCLWIGG